MKLTYTALAVAISMASHVQAKEVQQLALTEVNAEAEQKVIEVTSQELEIKQVNDIKGALNQFAGVSVSNGVRYSQKTYLRGVEEHAANITIDGVRQDGQMFHHGGNQIIDTSMLKAVSVELGASSVLSGYGALTGAVEYTSKNPQDLLAPNQDFGARAALSFDNATEFKQVNLAAYGRASEKLSLLGIVNYNESGDIDTPDADPIISKHSEMKSGLIKAVYDIDQYQQIVVNGQRSKDEGHREFSGEKPGRSVIEEALNYNGYERDTFSLVYTNQINDPLLNLYVNAYYNSKSMLRNAETQAIWAQDDQGEWYKTKGTNAYAAREYNYDTFGLDIRNASIVNGITWTYGLESFRSEQSIDSAGLLVITPENGQPSTKDVSVQNGPTATLLSGYAQAEFNINQFTIVPGVRYDNYKLGGVYDLSFNKLSPKLATHYQASDNLKLTLGYGKLFKGPALPETLMLNNDIQQGDNVVAESGDHIEFNLTYDLSQLLSVSSATAFANIYRFEIDNKYHPTKNTSLNRDRFDLDNQGFEAGLQLSDKDVSAYINYSYNDGENGYPGYVTDDEYSGSHEVNLGLSYNISQEISIGWNATLVKDASLTRTSLGRDETLSTEDINKVGYGVNNLWLSYQPAAVSGLKVNVAIDNVFDKAYQNHKSFGLYWGNADYNDNEVGRNFKASISYQF